MSQFEFFFSLFGLLLGFSLVEMLGGFAKAVEARLRPNADGAPTVRLGWLTPLLGIFVMLDLLSFWASAWFVRDNLRVSGAMLLGALFFASSYYLAAHLVFPPDPASHAELDSHYFRVRRLVLGAMVAMLGLQIAFWLSAPALAVDLRNPELLASTGVFIVLVAALMLVRGRIASAALLALLIARYIYQYLT